MKGHRYDIIDRDHNEEITAEDLQAAISLPAHAQSLSQLIIHYESEWRHERNKWDVLDEVLGHSGSTPLLNWFAEKDRIKEISWWNEVAGKVGLPVDGQVYHMHPVGLLSYFCLIVNNNLTNIRDIISDAQKWSSVHRTDSTEEKILYRNER